MDTDNLPKNESIPITDEQKDIHQKNSHHHPKNKTAEVLQDDEWKKHPGGG